VRALEAATGLHATVFGKPNAPILEAARARAGGGRPLVIGDRVETDIEGARRLRWDSVLVLTGISTRDDLRAAGIASTYVVEDLRSLVAG
jgi:ribonucleotide monophosphatase NagD (HAD superfamily)